MKTEQKKTPFIALYEIVNTDCNIFHEEIFPGNI